MRVPHLASRQDGRRSLKEPSQVFCETMTQKDGLVLRARMEVLEQLRASMLLPRAFTYFRKLRNFSFMVTTPAASLQKLRSAQPTPLCRALFLGDVPQASQSHGELFERLDKWVIANSDAQKMFLKLASELLYDNLSLKSVWLLIREFFKSD